MLYAGLDLSRKRVDFHLLDGEGATLEVGAAPPDADGLDRLTERLARHGAPIRAAIWCRRSGCPTRACALNASGRVGGCTSSATAPA